MCDCYSYNLMIGATPETVLTLPTFAQIVLRRQTVCVDACIVEVVLKVWDAGIITYGCCCGHNDTTKRSIIVSESDIQQTQEIVGESFNLISVISSKH